MTRAKFLSEFLGTAGLLVVVVGSGIMGESLAQGNQAMALLANSLATGAGLYALIQTFGSISGAHFNPAVSFAEWIWKKLSGQELVAFVTAQLLGAVAGVWLSHFIFGVPVLQISQHDRGELRLFVSEIVATFGLILVIARSGKRNVEATPMAVSLYITAAYWCTSSTSFANPAVTLARSLTNTFSGIHSSGVPGFIIAQFCGTSLAIVAAGYLSRAQSPNQV